MSTRSAIRLALAICVAPVSCIHGTLEAGAKPASIAVVHDQKCGECHDPPAPGIRPRPEVERALGRHRKRVKLTADQWQAMIEYLAVPEDSVASRAQ